MGDIKFGIFIKIMSKYLQTLFPIFSIFLSKVQGAVTDDINTINSRVTTVQSSVTVLQIIVIVILVLVCVFLLFAIIGIVMEKCTKKDQTITPEENNNSQFQVKVQNDGDKNDYKHQPLKSENISVAELNRQGISPVIKDDEHQQQFYNNERIASENHRNSEWKIVNDPE